MSKPFDMWKRISVLVTTIIVCACSTVPYEPPSPWSSEHFRDHMLAGTVWSAQGKQTHFEKVINRAAHANFVVIGEVHTNPDHHVLQAEIIRELVGRGKQPAVVFEMIPQSLQGDVDAYLSAEGASPLGFGKAVNWNDRGWPDWEIYQPILDVTTAAGLPILAGNADNNFVVQVAQSGMDVLSTDDMKKFSLDIRFSDDQISDLKGTLKDAHCGFTPDNHLENMVVAQRLRDGAMAATLVEAVTDARAHGGLLIAGNGHGRRDWGVPFVLRHLAPDLETISIGLIEVAEDGLSFSDYGWLAASDQAPFDFVIFTPRFDTIDYCEELRKRMHKAFPEKHALGLDPMGGNQFSGKKRDKTNT